MKLFVTGPLYSGKRNFARSALGCTQDEFSRLALWDAQDILTGAETPAQLTALADVLAQQYQVVLATEVGGGVVPMDATARAKRENAGRLSCLLAERADTVVRIFCGLPLVLKTGQETKALMEQAKKQ